MNDHSVLSSLVTYITQNPFVVGECVVNHTSMKLPLPDPPQGTKILYRQYHQILYQPLEYYSTVMSRRIGQHQLSSLGKQIYHYMRNAGEMRDMWHV